MDCRLFNVGNTHVQIADLCGGTIHPVAKVPTSEFHPEEFAVPEMAAASVVPVFEELLRRAGALIVSPNSERGPVDLSLMKRPETLGADRLANAASLIFSGPLPALCVDFGTAINMEFVDSERRMRGGAILPGRLLLRRSLHDYTAKLPLTEIRSGIPDFPGNNTVDAIDIGVDAGALGAVREILLRMERQFAGKAVRRVACGGDAPFFLRELSSFEYADETFTLRGIAGIWKHQREHSAGVLPLR